MARTQTGHSLLEQLPEDISYVIQPKSEQDQGEAGHWDGQNCVLNNDFLRSYPADAFALVSTLVAHETLHAIQGKKYEKEYQHMPTEQQVIHSKMMDLETRLQDVLMQEEFLKLNLLECPTTDWKEYKRLKNDIEERNPELSADEIERKARTQFVIDTWQGNFEKDVYKLGKQWNDPRNLERWTGVYDAMALENAAFQRPFFSISPKDLTVDPSQVARHHDIMQEYIQRMGIDVPDDYFDTLDNSSLTVIRDPQELQRIAQHLGEKGPLQCVIVPKKNSYVKAESLVVLENNSTRMFDPNQQQQFEQKGSPTPPSRTNDPHSSR